MSEKSNKTWVTVLQVIKYIITLIIGYIGGCVEATML